LDASLAKDSPLNPEMQDLLAISAGFYRSNHERQTVLKSLREFQFDRQHYSLNSTKSLARFCETAMTVEIIKGLVLAGPSGSLSSSNHRRAKPSIRIRDSRDIRR